ncbi:MAG TPA: 16S rRNA (uracil(1498)-N(3))-methyltransferase [Sedimenticola thiotaurini]|uniref:Ribosomal RNA small subunit methyltransferase E n=1 Tax=Sedimenticola thiotaurini TaxID=1543721 RepID=A0A831WBI1_9GAMM|nr:16S rRNA (uracil(1498)-N(3))-methyltransferase [Sedimenticola thiotaurini]
MRIPRIHTGCPLTVGARLELEEQASRHLIRVLRLRPGDELILFDGGGRDWPARLLAGGRQRALVEITGRSDPEPAPALEIRLGISISRGERMDLAIQKAVELGVSCITPLLTERSVVRLPPSRLQKKLAHWRGVMTAACEQCGRSRLVALEEVCSLEAWLDGSAGGTGLLLDHRGATTLDRLPPPSGPLWLLAGPEGGLSEAERERARDRGFIAIRLGPRVLRTETAPLAAIAALQMLWGDFRR